ncbi:MAG TPA: nicotinamide-nucleotide amidohydrolase family protein [Acetobacteraceae bacterium]|nr:nicotinamide-nucleotide amidohydrolase family protein [Acetobacteraceae bacterium]
MLNQAALEEAAALLALCRARGITLATAESCTGGLVAAALTAIAGSSDVFERGFVTYSNAAKETLLNVPASLIASDGAVSEPVAREMATGAIRNSSASLAVSVTGVAGPGGGSAEKPVGLVWLGAARRNGAVWSERHLFSGDRAAVRAASVKAALALFARLAGQGG